jgi:hypothetical protein
MYVSISVGSATDIPQKSVYEADWVRVQEEPYEPEPAEIDAGAKAEPGETRVVVIMPYNTLYFYRSQHVSIYLMNNMGQTLDSWHFHEDVSNVLLMPARFDLHELLEALKRGRPAADQNWLDQKIQELGFKSEVKVNGEPVPEATVEVTSPGDSGSVG